MTNETERDPRWQASRKRRMAEAQSDFEAQRMVQQTLSLAEQCVHLGARVTELEDEVAAGRKLAHAVEEYLVCYTEKQSDMKKSSALHVLREAADNFRDPLRLGINVREE